MPTTETFYCSECGRDQPMETRAWVPLHGMVCQACKDTRYTSCQRCDQALRLPQPPYANSIPSSCFCSSCVDSLRTFVPTRVEKAKTFDRVQSQRSFGVELESDKDSGYLFLKMNSKSCFGVKFDCTCSGREFYSPILAGDEGLDEVTTLCEVAYEQGWEVDYKCGFHLHLDMRGENLTTLRRIAYAWSHLYEVLIGCVDQDRPNCDYCRQLISPKSIENTDDLLKTFVDGDRYNFFNYQSYHVHGTFENRLHEGTFDWTTIHNWIILNLRITDVATTLPVPVLKVLLGGKSVSERWAVLKTWIADKNVIDFYEARMKTNSRTARHFSH